MKRALRNALQEFGQEINPENGHIHRGGTVSGYIPEAPQSLKDVNELREAGRSARRGVTVAKGPKADNGLTSRRTAALHEIGHAMDPRAPVVVKRIARVQMAVESGAVSPQKLEKKSGRLMAARFNLERTANRNALALLARSGADQSELKAVRKELKKAFNSYRYDFIISEIVTRHEELGTIASRSPKLTHSEIKQALQNLPYLRGSGVGLPRGQGKSRLSK